MTLHATHTSKAILTNEEAVMLAYRLRDAVLHTNLLALTLYQSATPLLLEVVETVIEQTNRYQGVGLSDEEKPVHEYLFNTMVGLRDRRYLAELRTPRIERSVLKSDIGTRQPDDVESAMALIDSGHFGRQKKLNHHLRAQQRADLPDKGLVVRAAEGGRLNRVIKLRKKDDPC